jgi:DNA-binding transcriptional LysR family regulator
MPLMRSTARSPIAPQIERHLRRLNIEAPRQLEFDTSDTLVAIVAADLGWAITTPLCVLGPGLPLDRVTLAPMPSPGMTRRLTLITRSGELGRLPEQVGALARRILRADLLPKLERLMPWVVDQVRVG